MHQYISATLKLSSQKIANGHDIKLVLLSSIAITSAKCMKQKDFIKTDVRESIDFLDVEGVIAHLDECRKFGWI